MKKLLFLFILLSFVIFSCNKDSEPEPEKIRAYCYLYHFIPQLESVIWEVDGVELPEEQDYAYRFAGAVLMETATEEIEFVVKHPGTKEVLSSQIHQLEENKYYNVILCGSEEQAALYINELETTSPAAGSVKFQILHAIPGQGPIDIYMGNTTAEKRIFTGLDHLELSDPAEVPEFDARASMTATVHSEAYNPDSVLLQSIYNDDIVSGANYLTVLTHTTWDTTSNLTFWLYSLPVE